MRVGVVTATLCASIHNVPMRQCQKRLWEGAVGYSLPDYAKVCSKHVLASGYLAAVSFHKLCVGKDKVRISILWEIPYKAHPRALTFPCLSFSSPLECCPWNQFLLGRGRPRPKGWLE